MGFGLDKKVDKGDSDESEPPGCRIMSSFANASTSSLAVMADGIVTMGNINKDTGKARYAHQGSQCWILGRLDPENTWEQNPPAYLLQKATQEQQFHLSYHNNYPVFVPGEIPGG